MQENNFEKQVQQKMEDLKINPSEALWDKVARGIKKRKRDWKLVYLFLFIALMVGGGAILLWNAQPGNKKISAKENIVKTRTKENSRNLSPNKIVSKSSREKTGDQLPAQSKNLSKANDITVDFIKDSIKLINKPPHQQAGINKATLTKVHSKKYSTAPPTEVAVNSEPTEVLENKANAENNPGETTKADPLMLDENDPAQNWFPKLNGDHITLTNTTDTKQALTQKITFNKLSTDHSPSLKKADKQSPQANLKKWKYGANLSTGISATRNSYLGITGNSSASQDLSYSSPLPNNGTGSSINTSTSPLRVSTGLVAGVYAQKQLGKKTAFLAGLNYKYYSTKMAIGNRVDSLMNNRDEVFKAGSNSNYNNKFHFLELPVGILFKLSKSTNRLPVYLYTGFSISQLVKTNALQFDKSTGVYYRDDAGLNKTQVDLSARLLFSLQKNKSNSLLIGPQLNYSLTKMAGAGLYNKRHYSYFGIQMQKVFGK